MTPDRMTRNDYCFWLACILGFCAMIIIMAPLATDPFAIMGTLILMAFSIVLCTAIFVHDNRDNSQQQVTVIWPPQRNNNVTRAAIAYRRALPQAIIERLARDPSIVVREAIALYHALPTSLLKELARDPHPGVRISLLRRCDLPAHVLAILATDHDPLVRERVEMYLVPR